MNELFDLPPEPPALSIRPCDVSSGVPGIPCPDVIVTIIKGGVPTSAMISPSDLIALLSEAMLDAHRIPSDQETTR